MNFVPDAQCYDPLQLQAEVASLRDSVKEKDTALIKKDTELSAKDQRIEQLLDVILLLRKRQFGASADLPNKDQIDLFDEAELEQLLGELDVPTDQDDAPPTIQSQAPEERKKPVRRPLPLHFDRIEKILDLSDAQKAAMGDDWTFIGYDTSEQLAVIPRQHYVIVYKRAKYVPNQEDVAGAEQGVRIAPRPEQILPKSLAHGSVIADVITRKFVDGLPLYRQQTLYARDEIELSH